MLPNITIRCPTCHRQAAFLEGRFVSHGRGQKGCSGSGTPIPRHPGILFNTTLNTIARNKTSVELTSSGVQGAVIYEFDGPGHRERASEFAETLREPVFTGIDLLERLVLLEQSFPKIRAHLNAGIAFCLALVKKR